MDFLVTAADLVGTDPLTLVICGLLAAACAHFLQRISGHAYSGFAFWFILMIGALLADDLAVALEFYPPLVVGVSGASFDANWAMISESLPNVLIASTVGMSITCVTILGIVRFFQAEA